MGERAKVILNEYTAKRLLMRDSLDLDKFYNSDLKLLIKAAKEEIKRYEELIIKYDKELKKMNYTTIEIKEAPKKIEKLNVDRIFERKYLCDDISIDFLKADIMGISNKINEIIDEVNKLKESE